MNGHVDEEDGQQRRRVRRQRGQKHERRHEGDEMEQQPRTTEQKEGKGIFVID